MVNFVFGRTILCVCAVTLLLAGCKSPTAEDEKRLQLLNAHFGSQFTFSFESFDVYLVARSKSNDVVPQSDAEAIYRDFWFTQNQQLRSDTSYVYLNVYNRNGAFQYQLWWDAKAKTFGRGRQEHY